VKKIPGVLPAQVIPFRFGFFRLGPRSDQELRWQFDLEEYAPVLILFSFIYPRVTV
jgi:hypothetical protein